MEKTTLRIALIFALAATATAGTLLASAASAGSQPPPAPAVSCGTKLLYGKPLELRVRGKQLECAQVLRIVDGACRRRRTWTCWPPWTPGPALVWFRTREMFSREVSTVIEGLRYPCAEADATAEAWAAARKRLRGFPTHAQVLADDTLRCHLLDGLDRDGIVALLGRPDEPAGTRFLDYTLGTERDSFFTIDGEFLSVELDADGHFKRARIVQS
jgi:hypothetical protein